MLIAIISDLHANLDALQTCMAKIDELRPDDLICLGDMVGYGPNPREALDVVMARCSKVLLGNHDEALLKQPVNFNKIPREALMWTKTQFEGEAYRRYLDYLWTLQPLLREGEIVYSHGMLQSNVNYVEVPEDVLFIFERMTVQERVCFAGHSHFPCIWGLRDSSLYYIEAEEAGPIELGEFEKCWVNVGSIGQPRDRDNRSCFITYDTEKRAVTYHRIAYDVDKTAQKIRDIPGLDNFLADRLYRGI